MSTAGTPGPISQPATGWFPSLNSSGLPRAAINGMTQSFSLIYSLRDTVAQLQATVKTLVQYSKHSDRVQTNPQTVPDGALYFETDRNTVFYQSRLQPNSTTRDWFYAGGIYYNVLANQPADLNKTGDVGFLFLASDAHHLYAWNGTSWDQAL